MMRMNSFDDVTTDPNSFAWKDIRGQDRWETTWTPSFTSLTVVGDGSYAGRFRIVGRQCFFQVEFSAGTSIASTAGTTYFALPLTAKGYVGMAVMTNNTTNVAVGVCHIDVATSRCYIPSQSASGNTFNVCGWMEI